MPSVTMYKNTQNYQVLFLTIIFSKTRKVRYKDKNKQRIIKRKHKNVNIGNGQRREHVWISNYEGTINGDNTAKSITLKLDSPSKIKFTGDSYVSSLEDSDSSYSNIDFNGYKLYVNGTAIN